MEIYFAGGTFSDFEMNTIVKTGIKELGYWNRLISYWLGETTFKKCLKAHKEMENEDKQKKVGRRSSKN